MSERQSWTADELAAKINTLNEIIATQIDRITALESDAASQAGEIERLKARLSEAGAVIKAADENLEDVIGRSVQASRQLLQCWMRSDSSPPPRQPLREYCKDCDDTCNHSPRGGEGEGGGHKERP